MLHWVAAKLEPGSTFSLQQMCVFDGALCVSVSSASEQWFN